MEILGKTLWPTLPIFATYREGWSDNGSRWFNEPRLPLWLSWFDTPDNSLWGDTGWQTIHCKDKWNTYWGMALWLFRNSSVGFSRTVLAKKIFRQDVKYSGDPYVSSTNSIYGTFKATDNKGHWQYKKVFPLLNKNIGLNFGWQIDPMIKDLSDVNLCHYKVSIKIKDKTNGTTVV